MNSSELPLPTAQDPKAKVDDAAGPLAEYSALRAEILQSLQVQFNIFALQLTASAALFSFSLSGKSRAGFLLVIPLVTYALSQRYLSEHYGVERMSFYIAEELSPKVHGGLEWEAWNRRGPRAYKTLLSWFGPLPTIFPVTSVAAIAWVTPYVWFANFATERSRLLLVAAWVTSLIFTIITTYITWQSTRRSTKAKQVTRLDSPKEAR